MVQRGLLLFNLGMRNVWRNPKRSLITLLAIVIGIWSALSLAAFSRGLGLQMIDEAIFNLTGDIKFQHPSYVDDPVVDFRIENPEKILEMAKGNQRIDEVASRVRLPGVVMSERESAGVEIVGISPSEEIGFSFIGEAVAEGRTLRGPSDTGIIVGRAMLEKLETKLGRRVVLMTEAVDDSLADRGFRIIGVYDAKLESTERAFVFVGRETLQKLVGIGSAVSSVTLGMVHEDAPEISLGFKEQFPELQVSTWRELEPLVVAMVDMQDGILLIWYGIVVVAISFGLINTLFMAVFERTRELGMLRALGMRPNGVLFQIVFESVALMLLGALIGNAISWVSVWMFRDGIDLSAFASGLEMTGLSKIVYPTLLLEDVILANVVIIVVGALSSLYPAWKAARMKPVESLVGSH